MSLLMSLAPAAVTAYALNLLLHVTVICLLALWAARRVFRRDPAGRHFLCLTGLVCLLLSPALVGLEAKMGRSLVTLALPNAGSVESIANRSSAVLSDVYSRSDVVTSSVALTQEAILWGGWAVLSAYLFGVGWGVLHFARGCRAAARLKQNVSPWREPTDSVLLHTVEQALHAPAPPVFTSLHVASPIAIGLLHPAVILPEGLTETLSPHQLRHVLLHECAHVAFRHGLGGLLERIAGILFWPHPLVRTLCRELARAREEVCDNFASQEDGAACYARTLLMLAQGIDIAPNIASTLALLGTGTSLEARITGLLDPRRNRMITVKRWKLWTVTGAAIFAIGSTAAVRVVAAQGNGGQDFAGNAPRANTVPHAAPRDSAEMAAKRQAEAKAQQAQGGSQGRLLAKAQIHFVKSQKKITEGKEPLGIVLDKVSKDDTKFRIVLDKVGEDDTKLEIVPGNAGEDDTKLGLPLTNRLDVRYTKLDHPSKERPASLTVKQQPKQK
jgi:beta-lactamase regulating signal transducer with metallopeptidase domain